MCPFVVFFGVVGMVFFQVAEAGDAASSSSRNLYLEEVWGEELVDLRGSIVFGCKLGG